MGRNERDFCPFLFPSAVYGAYPSSSPSSTTSPPSSTTSPPPSYSCTHSSSSSLSITSPFAFPSTAEFSSTANFNQQCTEEIEVHGSSNTINFLQEFRLPRPPPAVAPAARHQQPANMSQSGGGFDMNVLVQGAQIRWLKPAEVLLILQNHENYELSQEQAQKPIGGSLFLYNKRVVRFFRRDGHNWRKKKDGRTVGEAHERLKVANIEALNCYYAHGEQNSNFQRRSYWMLDPVYEHIVLVHYRDICEGKNTAGSAPQLSPSTFSPSPTSYTTQNQDSSSRVSGLYNPYHNFI